MSKETVPQRTVTMKVRFKDLGEMNPTCSDCGHYIKRHGIAAHSHKELLCFDCLGVGQEMCSVMVDAQRQWARRKT